jgi:hypothetical protein
MGMGVRGLRLAVPCPLSDRFRGRTVKLFELLRSRAPIKAPGGKLFGCDRV